MVVVGMAYLDKRPVKGVAVNHDGTVPKARYLPRPTPLRKAALVSAGVAVLAIAVDASVNRVDLQGSHLRMTWAALVCIAGPYLFFVWTQRVPIRFETGTILQFKRGWFEALASMMRLVNVQLGVFTCSVVSTRLLGIGVGSDVGLLIANNAPRLGVVCALTLVWAPMLQGTRELDSGPPSDSH